ncbi:MAG: imidazole glycerol phosphate synthase subunit HisF [Bdellovibrionales bacterium]|nr:imidazole glycerol phosphate synthase subunit HisF [Bdellovibrionales bacterium]
MLPRVIPCLLLKGDGLVKGVRFKDHKYVGDPINAVRIFNEKEVDELLFLDVTASSEGRIPPIPLIEKLADECFMPFGVGGGIKTVEQCREVLYAGAEKVCITTAALDDPALIERAAGMFGSQSVLVGLEVRKSLFGGYRLSGNSGKRVVKRDPVEFAKEMESRGAGELLVTSVDCDGTMRGYDLRLVEEISSAVSIPVIACGGAGAVDDIQRVLSQGGASAASAGSLFVFHGPKRAVLITFPERQILEERLTNLPRAEINHE